MPFWVPLLIFAATTALSLLLRPKVPKPQMTLPPAPDEDTTAPIPVVFGTQRVPLRWVSVQMTGTPADEDIELLGFKVGTTHYGHHFEATGSAILTYGEMAALVDMVFDDKYWLSGFQDRQHIAITPTGVKPVVVSEGETVSLAGFTLTSHSMFAGGVNFIRDIRVPYQIGGAFSLRGGEIYGLLAPMLYGGTREGGGVVGYFTLRYGMRYPDLPIRIADSNDGAAPQDDSRDLDNPPWRPFTWVDLGLYRLAGDAFLTNLGFKPDVFRNGKTTRPPPVEFVVTRYPVGPAGGSVRGGGVLGGDALDANPVTCIWELLTNPDIGLGMPEWAIDEDSFFTAALWTGGGQPGSQETNVNYLGVSFTLDAERTGEDVIGALLETLDAVLFTDLATGKLKIWLIREPSSSTYGYGSTGTPLGGLAVLSSSNARLVKWTRTEAREQPNVVRLKYRDRQDRFRDAVHVERNVAAIAAIGREHSITIEPLGVCTRVIAERIAKRELRARSAVMRRATIEMTRAQYGLHVGKQFLADFPERGLSGVVMRVARLDWGTPDDPTIHVEAVEDVYGRPAYYSLSAPPEAPPDPLPIFVAPQVMESMGTSASYGVLEIWIVDPDELVTGLSWWIKSGPEDWSAVIVGDLENTVQSVPLSAAGTSNIRYLVTWTDPSGAPREVGGTVQFGASAAAVDAPQPVVIDDGAGGFETVYDSDGNAIYH